MKAIWIYIFLTGTIPFWGYTQIDHEKDHQFFNYLYNFQFSDANLILTTIDSVEETGRYNFLRSHYMRWNYLPMHQQGEQILDQYSKYLQATDIDENNNKLNYLYINSALLKAEFNYNQGNYYKAFQAGAKVYDVVNKNLAEKPEQEEVMFLSALYHYFYQYYRAEKPIYEPMMWFFKEGDKETGLKWLKMVAKGESIAKTEALIYLSHIYLRLENEPDSAYKYAEELHLLYPDNLKFYELKIESSLAKNREIELAEILIQELMQADQAYFIKYGVCYNAIFVSKYKDKSQSEKIRVVNDALNYIENNGGGNHLSSLLHYTLFEITGEKEYLELKKELEQYKYILTGYSK